MRTIDTKKSAVLDYSLDGKRISAACLTDFKHNKKPAKNLWEDSWIGWRIDDVNKKWGKQPFILPQQFDFASMVHPTASAQTKQETVFELYAIIDRDTDEPYDLEKHKLLGQRMKQEYWAHVVKDVAVPNKEARGVTTVQKWYSFRENMVQLRGTRDEFDEKVAPML